MKRTALLTLFFLAFSLQSVLAATTPAFRVSVGGGMVYDPMNQDPGSLAMASVGYRVLPSFEVEVKAMRSGEFELDSDFTGETFSLTAVTLGGRFITSTGDGDAGFVSFGLGGVEVKAEEALPGADSTRTGLLARMGVGVDLAVTDAMGLTLESAFSRGFGNTDEVFTFDVTTSLFYRF